MSFFSSLFSEAEKKSFWNEIQTEQDYQNAIESSLENTVVIFKHSIRCMISKTILRNFEREISAKENLGEIKFYYLDLINHRDISNKIAEELGVTHQSPQIIIIKDKKAIKNASHDNINLDVVIK